jgi:hypothetical protein
VWADIAQAQWVMLARRAVGRVEQMSQKAADGKTTYDTAAVIVEVPAAKVYATVQRSVRAAAGITVTNEDPVAKRIEFTNGTQVAGIQAIDLGDNLTQLLVSSAHVAGPNAPTLSIVQHIMAACKEMNVECSRGT